MGSLSQELLLHTTGEGGKVVGLSPLTNKVKDLLSSTADKTLKLARMVRSKERRTCRLLTQASFHMETF